MADFNQILTPGDVANGMVNVVVEISAGGNEKIEWNRTDQMMEVDRLEPTTFPEPTNYGFIPQTIGEDGDGLDVLIISEMAIPTGTSLMAKIIGVMKFDDEGQADDKIIVVPTDDQNRAVNSLADLPKEKIDQITYYFNHYKDYKKLSSTSVKGWGDAVEAQEIIYKSIERWNKNQQKQ